ncbi:DUF6776 family protein [Hahella ganghwensis]|uniref:DUF6776 family protein n=1 Tax=Hahella ganghwensis TaxID=286420 RepID=UPI00037C9194|nr:DUF6776 family protein [Hahella ganghwensis]
MKSAEEKLIVVPYRPAEKAKRHLLAWAAVVLSIFGGITMGWYTANSRSANYAEQNRELKQMLESAEDKATELAQKVANLERGRVIDQVANRDVQSTVQSLESKILQLEEDIAFYKNIMAPSGADKGLQIQKMELHKARGERRFQYKLVLTQVADNNSYIQGLVAVNLIGSLKNKKEILPLRDVAGAEDLGVKFRFRYFQDIAGELELPEGFAPEQIQVVAQASGKKATKIERTFDWKVEE